MERSPRFERWFALALAGAIGGCDDSPQRSGNVTVVDGPTAPTPDARSGAPTLTEVKPSPSHAFSGGAIEREPIPSTPISTAPLRMVPRTFIDPPLPAELLDDGDLKPLPTRARPLTSDHAR